MRRRSVLASPIVAVLASTRSNAQPASLPVVGALMLGNESDPEYHTRRKAFVDGLAALGWIDGRTVHIDFRWAGGDATNLNRMAGALVALKPRVILANGTPAVVALKKATSTVPVVSALVQDPVKLGLVTTLARPGGNVTGFTYINPEIIQKWRELLSDVAPGTKRAALLFDPTVNPQYNDYLREIGPAGPGGMAVVAEPVKTLHDLGASMAQLGQMGGGAVILPADSFVLAHRKEIAGLALKFRLPSVAVGRQSADDGILMSYGPDTADIFRRAAAYVDRILKGEKPEDMPMQEPDKLEFVLNLKTAKLLGVAVPPLLLARATEVLE
jgi:putative ABC transport system substrate-binding protein